MLSPIIIDMLSLSDLLKQCGIAKSLNDGKALQDLTLQIDANDINYTAITDPYLLTQIMKYSLRKFPAKKESGK